MASAKSARLAARAPDAVQRPCRGCGRALERTRDEALYCSPRCRAVVWRRTRRRVGLGPRR